MMPEKRLAFRCKAQFIQLVFFGIFILYGCTTGPDKKAHIPDTIKNVSGNWNITLNSISPEEFKAAELLHDNEPYVTTVDDSVKLEMALSKIDKTYTDSEKELAREELCNSPRCLTIFKAYYPGQNLYLFNIKENHTAKATFVRSGTNEIVSGNERAYGDFGVLSKTGYWVGLKREDSDNYLKLEVSRFIDARLSLQFSVDFTSIDINENEKMPVFWSGSNTIYVSAEEPGEAGPSEKPVYYVIKFAQNKTHP
jgi:hypothetical protein